MSDRFANLRQRDVRAMAQPRRHVTIFSAVEGLAIGQAVLLITDREPMPLQYQLNALNPGHLDWEYVETGPYVWRVRILRK